MEHRQPVAVGVVEHLHAVALLEGHILEVPRAVAVDRDHDRAGDVVGPRRGLADADEVHAVPLRGAQRVSGIRVEPAMRFADCKGKRINGIFANIGNMLRIISQKI